MGAAFLIGLAGAAVVLAFLIAVMGIWPVHWGELDRLHRAHPRALQLLGNAARDLVEATDTIGDPRDWPLCSAVLSERSLWPDLLFRAHRATGRPRISRLLRHRGAAARRP